MPNKFSRTNNVEASIADPNSSGQKSIKTPLTLYPGLRDCFLRR